MFKYILFDLDGTLTNSKRGIFNSLEYCLEHFGICVEDKSILNSFIGPPLHESFKGILGFDSQKADEAVRVYREYFAERGLFENEVYPQVYKCLESLVAAGKNLLVATSKPEIFARRILEHFDLSKYFDFVAAATLDKTRDKKSDIVHYALESIRPLNKEEVVMVGDRKHDILGAAENGISSIGVLYGYGSKEELSRANATYIAATPMDIVDIVIK